MSADAFIVAGRLASWCHEPERETDQGHNQAPPSVAVRQATGGQARRGESCTPCAPFEASKICLEREDMELVYQRCCGIDIHKKIIVACVITETESGQRHKEICTFRTVTSELLELLDWLKAAGCTHVAMESTGVYTSPPMLPKGC